MKATSFFGEEVAQLQEFLAALERDPGCVDELLAGLDPGFFVVEQGWRATFSELMARPHGDQHLKILALEEYLHFLLKARSRPAAPTPPPDPYADTDAPSLGPDGLEGHLRTIVPGRAGPPARQALVRLPANETVTVRPGEKQSVDIWLSRHCFRFHRGPMWVDPHDRTHMLHEGRNFIGRAPFNDVTLDPGYTDVSRRHLILDIRHGRLDALTDVSSTGTLVPRDLLALPGGATPRGGPR